MRETMLLIQSIVPGETIGSPAREAGLLFMWRGVSFWHRDIVSGAGPRLRLLNTFHESRARP